MKKLYVETYDWPLFREPRTFFGLAGIGRTMLILSLLIAGPLPCVFADRESLPRDRVQLTENGKYILVMLGDSLGADSKIRARYPAAGLYDAKGSAEPLWTVDWYSSEVYPASDGKHLVRMGPWPGLRDGMRLRPGDRALEELAVAFYEQGELLRSYAIKDLIIRPEKLLVSVSHFRWKKRVSFDDAAGRLIIWTYDDRKLSFDISSGGMTPNS